MTIDKIAAITAIVACLTMSTARGQQTKPRPFDRVTGIVFTCGSATGFAWTGQACGALSAEFKKRAAASKLPFVEVPITADFSRKKRDTVDGFDQDKAVRVFWNFVESKGAKGQISAGLSSNIIYEPTTKDHPNIAPGQRISMNFYAQSVLFDPGATYAKTESFLNMITANFFQLGEGKI